MKVLNILTSGEIGGIESLCRDIGIYSKFENGFCFLSGNGKIYEEMKKNRLKTYDLSKYGKKISLIKFFKLVQIAKEYDIITVHHGDPIIKLYYYYLIKFTRKKSVTYVHSCFEEKYFYTESRIKKIIAKTIFSKSLKQSDKIVFVSKAGLNSYIKQFDFDSNKAKVIYNGIGEDKIIDGSKNYLKNFSPYTITYIGRLVPVKGVAMLINAVEELSKNYSIKLQIVGDGPDRENIEKKVNCSSIKSITSFVGKVADVKPYLKNTHIFVYPSIWQEVFGISIVEAMAYGCICIANNVGGIPEIIDNGKNGFINYDLNYSSLKATIERALLLLISGNQNNMSLNAKKSAKKFDIKNTISNLSKLYSDMLDDID